MVPDIKPDIKPDTKKDFQREASDAALVLLPGSELTRKGIDQVSEISHFDPFIIENKLKIKLPNILCPVNSREIMGAAGDRLESAGIAFLAVKKSLLGLGFSPFTVSFCEFGKKWSRFYNKAHDRVEIYNEENIFLIQGCYQTAGAEPECIKEKYPVPERDCKKIKTVSLQNLNTFWFVMLYQVMDMNPLIFIDRVMDYTVLGSLKKMTVTANFKYLRHQLETTFSRKADPALLKHGYVLEQDRQLSEIKTKKLNLKSKKGAVTTAISNENAANCMSRLMFFQWCKENGWINRIMPGV